MKSFIEKETPKKVLILGAGASITYGFPSGTQLVKDIIQYCNQSNLEIIISSQPKLRIPPRQHICEFIEDLENSGRDSIDAFLKDRPEYIFIGKLTIASVLRNKENREKLRKAENDWCLLLINSIFVDKNTIPPHNVTIITFNYDRSFEERCYQVLNARGWEHEYAKKAVESFTIIHVYGRLAHLDWEVKRLSTYHGPAASSYGGKFHHIPNASQEQETYLLKVIGENIQLQKPTQDILKQAHEVYFMGFGYHASNMNVLGFKESEEYQNKKLYGTCRGNNKKNLEARYPHIQFEELDCINFAEKYFS